MLDLVDVMDRLRSPGGCPWDAEQTHASLAPYAVEEAYELADAIEGGDLPDLVDELGDVLLQVVFHARVGEDGDDPFDIDDVARGIVAKLRRRHPHVFDGVAVSGAAEVETNWDAIKAVEKPDRVGPLDGLPRGMPPLERAVKVAARLDRAGLLPADPAAPADTAPSAGTADPADVVDVAVPAVPATMETAVVAGGPPGTDVPHDSAPGDLGEEMLRLVLRARREGRDVAAALRSAVRRLEERATGDRPD
ncbi:MazG family protein [Mobilicoccus pelagius]|uniref:MazG family protein n=1 Tax=Mobilicoccus pelagius TaxID=746032 RepID=UPI0002EA681C|nr:MazG family protein [Mobilicoccus pelagius]